jgi:hypothetical protein
MARTMIVENTIASTGKQRAEPIDENFDSGISP